LTIDNTKVSGSTDLTDYPTAVIDGNLIADLYTNINSVNRYSWDGEKDSSQYATNAAANCNVTGSQTWMVWAKMETFTSGNRIMSFDKLSDRGRGMYANTGNTIRFQFYDTAAGAVTLTSTSTFASGEWFHVAWKYDSTVGANGTCYLYINGVLEASGAAAAATATTTADFGLGGAFLGASDVASSFWDGQIKSARIYDSALSENTIIENMYKASHSHADLQGEWLLENDYTDESGNGYTLTPSGSPVFVENVPFVAQDLRFTTDEAGTIECPFEVVYMVTGSSLAEVHVKLPTVSYSADTVFYVWYNNASARAYAKTDWFGQYRVWDSNFVSVYHMNDVNGKLTDSTVNANLETFNGDLPDPQTGQIGKGQDFDGTGDYVGVLSQARLPGNMTVSLWFHYDAAPTNTDYITSEWAGGDLNFVMGINNSEQLVGVFGDGGANADATLNGSTTLSANTWYYGAIKRTGTSHKVWLNGASDASQTGSYSGGATTVNRYLGVTSDLNADYMLDGMMDELRFSTTERSDDWCVTEYNNQNSPSTFITGATLPSISPSISPSLSSSLSPSISPSVSPSVSLSPT
jgi:hypothetical protein